MTDMTSSSTDGGTFEIMWKLDTSRSTKNETNWRKRSFLFSKMLTWDEYFTFFFKTHQLTSLFI